MSRRSVRIRIRGYPWENKEPCPLLLPFGRVKKTIKFHLEYFLFLKSSIWQLYIANFILFMCDVNYRFKVSHYVVHQLGKKI